MLDTQYRCKNEQRRNAVRTTLQANGLPVVNGIDYLEVSPDQKTLLVYFLHPLPPGSLTQENVEIEGGTRLRSLQVESVSSFADRLTVRVNTTGDLSPYILRLVESGKKSNPPPGFDPQLSQVEFLFHLAELSDVDCEAAPPTGDKPPSPPAIDYLAKDYASFRQLMLDRLAVTMPRWKERSPSDLGIALVELVAYAADHLSYYQDAVATEAYVGTARRRRSIRRHARLLNYPMHDGCNARTWVALQVSDQATGQTLLGATENRPGTRFLTRSTDLPPVLTQVQFGKAVNGGAQVFESLHDLPLHPACNTIHFYTWGDEQCTLPAGATRATLEDRRQLLQKHLKRGMVLILEQVLGKDSGRREDADPTQRHAVRLTGVQANRDPLFGDVDVVEVEWGLEDALPFALVISTQVNQRTIANISVVRGNVVLVDHGRSLVEPLPEVIDPLHYRPRLQAGPLTQQGTVQNLKGVRLPFDPETSAAAALRWELRHVQPAIALREDNDPALRWQPQRDLLNSDRFAREFVVETEEDGRAYLRFGDGDLGRQPRPGIPLHALYRIGNGTAGNVGADVLTHIYSDTQDLIPFFTTSLSPLLPASSLPIRNPLPARGGIDPEAIEQVRLYAPQAFRSQERAVTEADYASITQRFPGVRRALATRRWTGSWYTIFITVDRAGGLPIDNAFKQQLRDFLERYRLSGHDLEIESPRFVPLTIRLRVTVFPDYFQSEIKQVLQRRFSNQVLPDGQLGFFHPDNFSFGQPVYLSQVIATAMQVAGVQSVAATWFQRQGAFTRKDLDAGQISFARLEIAQLNNDPSAPEEGDISFVMEGGL
jgi:hypothetical protein